MEQEQPKEEEEKMEKARLVTRSHGLVGSGGRKKSENLAQWNKKKMEKGGQIIFE